jgi:hypothetical protein
MLIVKPNHANFAGLLITNCHYVVYGSLNLSLWLKNSIGIQFEIYET